MKRNIFNSIEYKHLLLLFFSTILLILLVFFGLTSFGIKFSGDICQSTGGEWQYNSCGSHCLALHPNKESYPKTIKERVKQEGTPLDLRLCGLQICNENYYCTCQRGKYFGSYQEGCIDESERILPTKEVQEEFDRKTREFEEIMINDTGCTGKNAFSIKCLTK